MKIRLLPALLLTAAISVSLGACVPKPVAAPPPRPIQTVAPAPVPAPTPRPTPTPAPSYASWMDAPRTPGNWFYKRMGQATYAVYGKSDTDFVFVMRCDLNGHSLALGRVSAQTSAQPLRLRTETAERTITAQPRQGSIETLLAFDLQPRDPLLDAMAISKGRFAIEVPGEAPLYLPSWPEVSRVIEDCR